MVILGIFAFQLFWCIIWICMNGWGEWKEGCNTQKVLPGKAGGQITCAVSCHHTASAPQRMNHWYFLQWGKDLSRGNRHPLQMLHSVFSRVFILPVLCFRNTAVMVKPQTCPRTPCLAPKLLFLPLTNTETPCTHLCAETRVKASFPERFPRVAASWTRQDPYRELLISHLIKWGLQRQGSFVSCHVDLSFKDQGGRESIIQNMKEVVEINFSSHPFLEIDQVDFEEYGNVFALWKVYSLGALIPKV